MYLCESMLMAEMVLLSIYVTYTDITNGIIQNKALALASGMGAIINFIYFLLYARDFLLIYVLNLITISIIAIALYGFHFWAAGDSKLLICVNLLFPARLYDQEISSFSPGINAVLIIFLLSFFYILVESIVLFLKKERFYAKASGISAIKGLILGYATSFLYLRAFSELLRYFLKEIYYNNLIVFSFTNIFLAMMIYEKRIFRKWYSIIAVIALNLLFINKISFQPIYMYSYLILFAMVLLRYLLSGFNYKEIPSDSVQEGMVLAYPTVALFLPSKIKYLPKTTTEDIRSRITKDEADAIKRWKDSKYGKEQILIVRKIPFAVFICLGELAYFFIRIVR